MIDDEEILTRYEGDLELIQAVCAAFVHEQLTLVADLCAAVTAREREGVRKAAHALKGSANNVGAIPFRNCAQILEDGAMSLEWEAIDVLKGQLCDCSVLCLDQVTSRYLVR
jgi:HPt (histidine-containing phosphotransfer) domain-containing protein